MYWSVCVALLVIGVVRRLFQWSEFGKPPKTRPPFTEKAPLVGEGVPVPCFSPSSGEKFPDDRAFTKEQVDEVVRRAQEAQKDWANTTFQERNAVLSDLMEYIVTHQEEITKLSVQDSGKTMLEAEYGEILTTCEKIRWIMRNGESALQPESRSAPLLMFSKKARVEWHPLGVIAIIIPWNYPFHNIASAVVSALYSGNAAVVKVSEFSSWSRSEYQRIFRKILAERGHNPDLVQIITGFGDTGAALCQSNVDKIFFIGSPATGKRVMEAASKNLIPVILELGGKDPFVIFDDADFDHALETALRGVYINNGQNCIAAERIYVHAPIYDKFVEAVSKRVKNMKQGDPLKGCVDCGAMTMPQQVKIVEDLVNDAVNKGARLLSGGKRGAGETGSLFFEPTLLVDVDHTMKAANEEAFGPIMLVIKFNSEEHLISMANSTGYGLSCSIFTQNYERAERVGKKIMSGMLVINDFGVSYMIQSLPFGGVKVSGFGKFNGPEGLRGFCLQKSVVTDRAAFLAKMSRPPPFLNYPVPATAPTIVQEGVKVFYGRGIFNKLGALFRMLKTIASTKYN